MPPTLFQLPNLYQPVASEFDQVTVGTPQQMETAKEKTALVETAQHVTARKDSDHLSVDTSKGVPSIKPSVASSKMASLRQSLPTHWVETCRKNSTMMALLFAVVLAAAFVGYRSQQRAEQANNDTAGETQLDTSDSKLPAAFASSLGSPVPGSTTASDSSDNADEPEILTAQSAAIPPSLKETGVTAKTISAGASQINPYAADSSREPLATTHFAEPIASSISASQSNQPVGFDVSTESINVSLDAPHTSRKDSMVDPDVQSPRYPESPTPRPITDWSLYLPAFQ